MLQDVHSADQLLTGTEPCWTLFICELCQLSPVGRVVRLIYADIVVLSKQLAQMYVW